METWRARESSIGPLELLVLQPTPFCNLDCDYCYLPHRTSTRRMSPETLEATMARVFESGLVRGAFNLLWHAGEPMAAGLPFYRDALDRIERATPSGVKIHHSFQTNGTLFTDEWCQFIREKKIWIGVSVDGPAELNDLHRKTRSGKGSHDKVMKGIALLHRHQIPFSTISVLTREALERPDQMFAFFVEAGCRRVGFNVEEKEGIHDTSTLERACIRDELSAFMARFYELNEAHGRIIDVREFTRFERSILGWSPRRALDQAATGGQENAPFRILSVDWEGGYATFSPELLGMEVKPYGKFTLGNVHRDPIAETLLGARFREVVQAIRAGVRKCERECAYFSICGGGAPANKYYENGTFDSSETMHCRLHTQTIAETVLQRLELRVRNTRRSAR